MERGDCQSSEGLGQLMEMLKMFEISFSLNSVRVAPFLFIVLGLISTNSLAVPTDASAKTAKAGKEHASSPKHGEEKNKKPKKVKEVKNPEKSKPIPRQEREKTCANEEQIKKMTEMVAELKQKLMTLQK